MGKGAGVCVAGGGSWGTALAHHLASCGHAVTLWMRDTDAARTINATHRNPRYVKEAELHPDLCATDDPAALAAPVIVSAVPCQSLRSWLEAHKGRFCARPVLINTAKGLETGSLAAPGRVVTESLGGNVVYAMLSGPSFAAEVLNGLPVAVVLACADAAEGMRLRALFAGGSFRCYGSEDVTGVEIGGALKNVTAIAAGVCDGLGFGHNARAALITRGLAEITRLGVALGARPETFMGLSGMGDLFLTCAGDLSRNRQVGLRLGRGEKLEDIVRRLGMVAEGVATSRAMVALAERLGVDAPLAAAVLRIVEGRDPAEEARLLLNRPARGEFPSA